MDLIRHHSRFGQYITMEQRSPYFGAGLCLAYLGVGVYTEDYMLQAASILQFKKDEASCCPGEISILGCRTRSTSKTR